MTTIKIADQAVTIPVGAVTAGPVTIKMNQTILMQSVSLTTNGEPVQLLMSCLFFPADNFIFAFRFYRDSTIIYEHVYHIPDILHYVNSTTPGDIKNMAFADVPAAGLHTYSFQVFQTNTGGDPNNLSHFTNIFMSALALKK